MSRRDLPDMSALALGHCMPLGSCIHTVSGKSQPHMLHILCNTFGILKICRNLPNAALLLYSIITTDAINDYGIFILMFL